MDRDAFGRQSCFVKGLGKGRVGMDGRKNRRNRQLCMDRQRRLVDEGARLGAKDVGTGQSTVFSKENLYEAFFLTHGHSLAVGGVGEFPDRKSRCF